MASVVNLNRLRKAKKRADEAQRAAENRARHGRSKAERRTGARETERTDQELDSKRLE